MTKGNPKPLTPKLQAELDVVAAMPESEIDIIDMSPIVDWTHAVRGPLHRPVKRPIRVPNRETIEAIEAGEGGEVFRAPTVAELMKELNADD